jgi:tetratricopeptide (TPR) repeat protein
MFATLGAIALASARSNAQSNGAVINLAGAGATCLSNPAQMTNLQRERAMLSGRAHRELSIIALPEDQAQRIQGQNGFPWCAACAMTSNPIWVCIGDPAAMNNPGGAANGAAQPPPMRGRGAMTGGPGTESPAAEAEMMARGNRWNELRDFSDGWLRNDQAAPQAWYYRGLAYENLNDQAQAASDYGQAVRLDPQFGPAQFGLARSLMRQDQYPQAIDHLQVAVRAMPNNARAWSDLGVSLTHSGRPQEAIPAFERAMSLAPNDLGGVGLAAEAYMLSGNWQHGAELLERAIKKQPFNQINVYWMQELGGAYNKLGDYRRSEQVFEATLRNAPNDPNTWQYLWQDYSKTGDTAKAQQAKATLDRLTGQNQMTQAHCQAGSIAMQPGRCVGIPDLLRNEQLRRQQN